MPKVLVVRGQCERRRDGGTPCLADLEVLAKARLPCQVCAPHVSQWARLVRLMLEAAELPPGQMVRREVRRELVRLRLAPLEFGGYTGAAVFCLIYAVEPDAPPQWGWGVACVAFLALALQVVLRATRP